MRERSSNGDRWVVPDGLFYAIEFSLQQHRVHQPDNAITREMHNRSCPWRLVMEACGTAHYWGRTAQLLGYEVKLLHAKYVKAYVESAH